LVALERSKPGPDAVSLAPEETYALPAIVWAEALIGVRMAKSPSLAARRLARLEAVRRTTGIEEFTDIVSEHYADIFSELARQGTLIPQNDIAVAATARRLDFGVLVGPEDEAHFRRISGLAVHVL